MSYEQVLCNAYLKGGIDSLGLIEIDAAIASYSSEANWNTAIAAGKARVIKGINCEYRDWETDRKSTRLNSSHRSLSRMPSSA